MAELEALWRSKLAEYQLFCAALKNGDHDTPGDWQELRGLANRLRREILEIGRTLSGA